MELYAVCKYLRNNRSNKVYGMRFGTKEECERYAANVYGKSDKYIYIAKRYGKITTKLTNLKDIKKETPNIDWLYK